MRGPGAGAVGTAATQELDNVLAAVCGYSLVYKARFVVADRTRGKERVSPRLMVVSMDPDDVLRALMGL